VPNNLIAAIDEANQTRKNHIACMIKQHNPKTVGIYKLAMKSDSDNSRSSAVLGIIELLQTLHIKIIIFDPALKKQEMFHCPVIADFEEFKNTADIIIANRVSDELKSIMHKVYSRDIFRRD
jgi:UDPglucose 6-dehydrogenase